MISGTGIDIIETNRVAEKIARELGFREYVFSENEIAYCESKTNKAEHYAARFAAKEAFLKALGTGFPGGLNLNEIEIMPNDAGKPEIYFKASSLQAMQQYAVGKIHLSMSHLTQFACAMVVIETKDL
jgi:holo-[acyl-carrier protein] synthase